jgi:hypothetical protein
MHIPKNCLSKIRIKNNMENTVPIDANAIISSGIDLNFKSIQIEKEKNIVIP